MRNDFVFVPLKIGDDAAWIKFGAPEVGGFFRTRPGDIEAGIHFRDERQETNGIEIKNGFRATVHADAGVIAGEG